MKGSFVLWPKNVWGQQLHQSQHFDIERHVIPGSEKGEVIVRPATKQSLK